MGILKRCPVCGVKPVARQEIERYGKCGFCQDREALARLAPGLELPVSFPIVSPPFQNVHPLFLDILDAWQVQWRPAYGAIKVTTQHGIFFIEIASSRVQYLAADCLDCTKACRRFIPLCIHVKGQGWTKSELNSREINTLALAYALVTENFDKAVLDQLVSRCKLGENLFRGLQAALALRRVVKAFPSVLEHPARRAIYEYISAHPGSTEEEVRSAFDLAHYRTKMHLNFLVKFGFLRRESSVHWTGYFPATPNPNCKESVI